MSNIQIISDGTIKNTKVFIGDRVLEGLNSLVIHPINPNQEEEMVTATINVKLQSLQVGLSAISVESSESVTSEQVAANLKGQTSN